jgi:hypothetical protein
MNAYIGSDLFSPLFIERNDEKDVQDNETEIQSDPITIIEASEAPDMADESEELINAGSAPDVWHVVPKL